MHVWTALCFHAEASDIELAQIFDEAVVNLNMFQLAFITLHKEGKNFSISRILQCETKKVQIITIKKNKSRKCR